MPGAGQSPLLLIGGLMSNAMRQMEMSPRRALYNPTLTKVIGLSTTLHCGNWFNYNSTFTKVTGLSITLNLLR